MGLKAETTSEDYQAMNIGLVAAVRCRTCARRCGMRSEPQPEVLHIILPCFLERPLFVPTITQLQGATRVRQDCIRYSAGAQQQSPEWNRSNLHQRNMHAPILNAR